MNLRNMLIKKNQAQSFLFFFLLFPKNIVTSTRPQCLSALEA